MPLQVFRTSQQPRGHSPPIHTSVTRVSYSYAYWPAGPTDLAPTKADAEIRKLVSKSHEEGATQRLMLVMPLRRNVSTGYKSLVAIVRWRRYVALQ